MPPKADTLKAATLQPLPLQALPDRCNTLSCRLRWPLATLVAALSLTFFFWMQASQDAAQQLRSDLQHDATNITTRIEQYLKGQELLLRGIEGLFNASDKVSRSEFQRYFQTLHTHATLSGFAGVAYHEIVLKKDLARHTTAIRQEGFKDYHIQPAGQREVYAPLRYIEPFVGANLKVLGFDPLSVPVERVAVEQARDTDDVSLSAKLTLAQDAGARMPGFVMYMPIYRGNEHDSVAARRAHFAGWIDVPFRMPDLMAQVLPEGLQNIDLEIYDGADLSPANLMFDANILPLTAHPSPTRVIRQLFYGRRTWTLAFGALSGYGVLAVTQKPQLVAASGVLLSLLLSLVVAWVSHKQREYEQAALRQLADVERLAREDLRERNQSALQEIVRQKTEHLEQALESLHTSEEKYRLLLDESTDPIFSVTPDIRYNYVNSAFSTPFGKTPQEVIGRTPHDFMPVKDADFRVAALTSAMAEGQERSVVVPHVDGVRWYLTTFKPIFNSSHDVILLLCISKNITQQKQIEQSLHDSQLRLELATEGANEGIWDYHLVTGQMYHSPQMHRMLGYTQEELPAVRAAWDAMTHPDDVSLLQDRMQAHCQDPDSPFDIIVRLRHHDGDWRFIQSRGRASRDAKGCAIRLTGTHIDVTQRMQSEKAAQAASLAKSEFLANMSHEIRTPMNGVVGMVDILQQTQLMPEQRRMLSTIQNSSQSLLHILNDILDYSKIEADKLVVERIPTHLRDVAEGVAQLMASTAHTKKINLSVFVAPSLPCWIVSDPTRLRQVLLNLLGNALKFTRNDAVHGGMVELRVEPGMQADGSPAVVLSVSDTGIGMSEVVVAKLFQPFIQADETTARQYGGTGLGLSISGRLVSLMGGQLTVRSTLGAGSQFSVLLPLQIATAPRQLPADPQLDGVQVHAVMHEATCMEAVQAYCTAAGAQVSFVQGLTLALERLRSAPPAATVLLLGQDVICATQDIALPKGVGLVRLTQRNSSSIGQGITVSSSPLLYLDLIQSVALACGRWSRQDFASRGESPAHARLIPPTVEQAQASGRLILLAEDNETNREVLQEQLHLLGYAADVAEDGVMALEKWRTGRYALLLTDCHMPLLDGFELTAFIRHEEEGSGHHMPIIAVTANAMQGEAQRCMERGMDDYLSKPLRLKELGPMLAKWLPIPVAAAPEASELPHPVHGDSTGVDQPATWDASMISQLVGDNPTLQRRLLEKFLIHTPTQISTMEAALQVNDIKNTASIAHALKSASRTVGAMALGDLCQHIETTGAAQDAPTCNEWVAGLADAFALAKDKIQTHLDTASH